MRLEHAPRNGMPKITGMKNETVEKLTDAKERSRSWVETARAFASRNDYDDEREKSSFEQRAVSLSGYTLNILKRYEQVLSYVESLSPAIKPPNHVIEMSVSALEVIQRFREVDEEKEKSWLKKLVSGHARVADISKDLAETPKAKRSAELEASKRSHAATERYSRHIETLNQVKKITGMLGSVAEYFHQPLGRNNWPLSFDAMAWLDDTFNEADGFDVVYMPSRATNAIFTSQFDRSLLASSFFRHHYLVFTKDSDREFVDRAVTALAELQILNVGVIWLGPEKMEDRIFLRPAGPPSPDRRPLLERICPRGRFEVFPYPDGQSIRSTEDAPNETDGLEMESFQPGMKP